jgi:hypothetical protein
MFRLKFVSFALLITSSLLGSLDSAHGDPACPIEFPKAGLCAAFDWLVIPTTENEAKLTLRFWDMATSKPIGPYKDPTDRLALELMMDMGGGHGHGSAPTRFARKAAGVYEFSRLFFVMLGDWQMKFQLRGPQTPSDPKGKILEESEFVYRVTE